MDSERDDSPSLPVDFSTWQRWAAILSSAKSAVLLLCLIPLLYLATDLLVYQGRLPQFANLPEAEQSKYREIFDSPSEWPTSITPMVAEYGSTEQFNQLPSASQHSLLYHTWNRHYLEQHISSNTAADYHARSAVGNDSTTLVNEKGFGILPTILRNQSHWYAKPLAWLASWNPWMHSNGSYLLGLFLCAVFLVFSRMIALNVAAHFASLTAIAGAARTRRSIYTHSLRIGSIAVKPQAQEEAGELITRKVETVLESWITNWTSRIRLPILILGSALILFVVDIWLALAVLLLAIGVWVLAGQVTLWFRRDGRLAERRAEARLEVIRENIALMQLVKSYLMERFNQARVERQLSELGKVTRQRLFSETLTKPTFYSFSGLAALVLAFLAGRMVLGGVISVAGFMATSAAFLILGLNINRWFTVRHKLRRGTQAELEIEEFLERRPDSAQTMESKFLNAMSDKMDFIQVSYREPGSGRMTLEDVSFSVKANSRTAFVCSKQEEIHAITYLLTRFLEPTAGEIKIDSQNLRWVTFDSLRTQVAIVLCNTTIFSDTVANNIGCGDTSFSLAQIIEASKLAHAHQFVQRLSFGYETPLADGGVSLRPGERYRIALARALLRDPSILILEEPMEPFDVDSVALIEDTLTRIRANRTLLIFARRNATLKHADHIIRIRNGRNSTGESLHD